MRRVMVVLSLLGFVAGGCASGEREAETSPPAPTPPSRTAEVNDHGTKTFTSEEFDLEVELDNFYFEPTFIKSPGGSKAKIELFNEGSVPHTFTIDELKVDEQLEPEERKEITVELGTETRYEFYCRFHSSRGMRGAFQPH